MKEENKNKNEVVSLNAPRLEVEGIEKFEERLEMKYQWPTKNMCSNSFYGSC